MSAAMNVSTLLKCNQPSRKKKPSRSKTVLVEDLSLVDLFWDKVRTVLDQGLIIQKRAHQMVLKSMDDQDLAMIPAILFDPYVRPHLTYLSYWCHGRLEKIEKGYEISLLKPCEEHEPGFENEDAFWKAYLDVMRQQGIVLDDSKRDMIESLYVELFSAKHSCGSVFLERTEENYVLWSAVNTISATLSLETYRDFIQPGLAGICALSKMKVQETLGGTFFSVI